MSKKKKKLQNHIVFILDSSGSMRVIKNEVVKTLNSWIDKILEENKKYNQETNVSLIEFANYASLKFFNADISKLEYLDDYHPDGMTALFDGLDLGVNQIANIEDKDVSYIFVVITDGIENNSKFENVQKAPNVIKNLQNRGNYSFIFLLPPNSANGFINKYNLLSDNVQEWTATKEGLKEVEIKTSGGISNYYNSRSLGLRSVDNFFVKTDLSSLKTSELNKKLDDVSNDFTLLEVSKEVPIKEFVESKTRKSYSLGMAYYLLIKSEKIQSHKEVLIKDKRTNIIYGGDKARILIGLPVGADAKVEPLNHGYYEIFVKSTSVNRKLPRGSKVLVKK